LLKHTFATIQKLKKSQIVLILQTFKLVMKSTMIFFNNIFMKTAQKQNTNNNYFLLVHHQQQ